MSYLRSLVSTLLRRRTRHAYYDRRAAAYLERARARLDEDTPASLFYAALELRSGIEARAREQLEPHEHVPASRKREYRIKPLARTLESITSEGRATRIRVLDEVHNELAVLYYTPVTIELLGLAGRLGDFLHAPRSPRAPEDQWWDEFRELLESAYDGLYRATRGTMLGAPIRTPDGGMAIAVMLPGRADTPVPGGFELGRQYVAEITHLEVYPEHLLDRH